MANGITIQDVFNRFYPDYLEKYSPSHVQQHAATNIINCKTGAYGANVSSCDKCGALQIHYNSCRNRCCPMCQAIPTEKWVDARREDVLDSPYFHIVFTVPAELNMLIYYNQERLYDALYKASAETILELSLNNIGIKPGIISVLHTWGSNLTLHPHIHMIVLGGGLTKDNNWKDKGDKFFLPVKVISKLFRGKYMAIVKDLYKDNLLNFTGSIKELESQTEFKKLLDICYEKEWVPHTKPTFKNPEAVIKYLGRYTHRIAISNNRILDMDESTVTFRYKDYRDDGKWKNMTISGIEFIRRFLTHVPPKRFVRLRHYGLLSSRAKSNSLTLCRNLIGCSKYLSKYKEKTSAEILKIMYNIDICSCKKCGHTLSEPKLILPGYT